MKVLWIVNKIFPYPAKKLNISDNVFGGWLEGLAYNLKENKDIDLAIATVYKGNKILKYENKRIIYYVIPGAPATKYNNKLEKYWKDVVNSFKPDLVHIHGTEYAHGLAFLNVFPNIKSVISIQGLVSVYEKVYYANIDISDILKNVTFRDLIKQDNLIQQKQKFKKRGFIEIETLKKAKSVIGRTDWDFSNIKEINPNLKYYKSNETLRKEFYNHKWNIENIEKNTIFCSQASYPIKGFHFLLKSIYIVKKQIPSVKLYVAGRNILKNKFKRSGYAKYIEKLIKKYELENQIEFTGVLNENQMINRLLKTNVFVLPSAIENSSNSLCEAMLLGMPCIATNTGGTKDILKDKKEGFLYPYTEPAMCAKYLCEFFNNKKLCIEYGENARKTAIDRHSEEKNVSEIISIYKDILGKDNL